MRLDLGSLTLDSDRHLLLRGDDPVHLSTKAFQLLSLLVENRPRAMSKDELQRALWPDTFVSDTSLTTLVNEIRTQLDDSAREHRLIRTVHGFGYAFEGAARPAPPSGCRLVWGERDLPLEEGSPPSTDVRVIHIDRMPESNEGAVAGLNRRPIRREERPLRRRHDGARHRAFDQAPDQSTPEGAAERMADVALPHDMVNKDEPQEGRPCPG